MYSFLNCQRKEESTKMETKQLKHIAVVEAESKAKLIKAINDAIDKNNLDLIHYNIEEAIEMGSSEEIWTAELFFTGPNVFGYDISGVDKIMNEFKPNTTQSRNR